MGTKMGPSFACLLVGYLEEKMFSEYIGPVPDLYKRYIDDVFGVSSDDEQELLSFINFRLELPSRHQIYLQHISGIVSLSLTSNRNSRDEVQWNYNREYKSI